MNDLDKLQALCDGATEGPWYPIANGVRPEGDSCVMLTVDYRIDKGYADAAFIAASRQAVPNLVAEVRRLRDRIENLKCALHNMAAHSLYEEKLKKKEADDD